MSVDHIRADHSPLSMAKDPRTIQRSCPIKLATQGHGRLSSKKQQYEMEIQSAVLHSELSQENRNFKDI